MDSGQPHHGFRNDSLSHVDRSQKFLGFLKGRKSAELVVIERVHLLVKLIAHQLGEPNTEIDRAVQIVDQKLNEKIVSGGEGAA